MNESYIQVLEKGCEVFHRNYRLYNNNKMTAFDNGAIRLITVALDGELDNTDVTVFFADASIAEWTTKLISSYNFQFGLAVSSDGKYVFVQTWENGLFCLDSHTGKEIWRTKSKRGVTSVFVNDNTILCHQRERALQLLDINTGEVLLEKRPATAWGFTSIDHNHIVCRVTACKWELIDTDTLETKKIFSHREFTGGHENYCINHIEFIGQEIIVRGFRNVWGDKGQMLPNLEFEHRVLMELNT